MTIGTLTVTYSGNFCPINTDCGLDIQYNRVTGTFTVDIVCLPDAH